MGILRGLAWVAACGELSATPGADAGPASTRSRCAVCIDSYECVLGECVPECSPDPLARCLEGFRCFRGGCVADPVPSCEESPCNRDQACVNGYCVTVEDAACPPDDASACGSTATCVVGLERCAGLPPCEEVDGVRSCRTGDLGAVCNVFVNESKLDPRRYPEVCLFGRCTSDAHCPAPLTCREIGNDAAAPPLGRCL